MKIKNPVCQVFIKCIINFKLLLLLLLLVKSWGAPAPQQPRGQ